MYCDLRIYAYWRKKKNENQFMRLCFLWALHYQCFVTKKKKQLYHPGDCTIFKRVTLLIHWISSKTVWQYYFAKISFPVCSFETHFLKYIFHIRLHKIRQLTMLYNINMNAQHSCIRPNVLLEKSIFATKLSIGWLIIYVLH